MRNNVIKVFMILMLIMSMVVCVSANANATVSVGSTSAERGEVFTLEVTLSDTPALISGGARVNYDDSVLELISGTWTIPSTMLMDFGKQGVANEGIFVYMTGATDINGGILLLTFKVKDDAPIGNTQVSCEALNFKDASGVVSVLSVSGTVSVSCPHTNAYAKNEIPSTCEEQGYAAGVYCDDCDTYIAGGERLPEVAHTYVGEHEGWIYKGSQKHERECTVCHDVASEPHNYGSWAPNEETGEHEKVCSGCGDGESEPHVFDAEIAADEYLATPADCHNAATYHYSCSECGLADKTTTFSYGTPLTHVFGETVHDDYKVNDANCQSPATYYKSCVCGEMSEETFTVGTKLPHSFTEIVDDAFKISDADCLNAAVYYKSCECGEKGSETFTHGTALGHDFAKEYTHDDKEHYFECQRDGCNVTDGREQHKGGTATCSAQAQCDACQQPYGEFADHIHDQELAEEDYLKSAANCTQPALYYKSCACGDKGTETFSFGTELGHNFAKEYSTNANYHYYECLRDGCNITDGRAQHTGGQATCEHLAVCDECKKEYGKLADHNYGPWASTGEDAQERQCQDCLTWETTAHSWDNGVVTTPATESTSGEKLLTCLDCGETKTVEVPPLTHKHIYTTDWEHDDAAHWYECLCGERANVNDHTWESQITLEATCESTGAMTMTCTTCGHTKTEEIPLADHTWDAGTVTTAATEQASGVMTHVCTVCRESRTEVIPMLEHKHQTASSAQWSNTETHHWISCSCGERLNEGVHSWVEEITTPASCAGKGLKTYTCSACGYTLTEDIPPLTHVWNEGEITTEATEEAAGVKTYTCTVCGSKDRTEEIPRLEPTQTPDEPSIPVIPEEPQERDLLPFIIILLICLIIILLVIILYMRKKDRYR